MIFCYFVVTQTGTLYNLFVLYDNHSFSTMMTWFSWFMQNLRRGLFSRNGHFLDNKQLL